MTALKTGVVVAGIVSLLAFASVAETDEVYVGVGFEFGNLFGGSNSYRTPKKRDDVRRAYRRYISRSDGISAWEAKVIAQYELILKKIDHDYDLRKPTIISETEDTWVVRIPPLFSLMKADTTFPYNICIDKNNGTISCFEKDTEREADS